MVSTLEAGDSVRYVPHEEKQLRRHAKDHGYAVLWLGTIALFNKQVVCGSWQEYPLKLHFVVSANERLLSY